MTGAGNHEITRAVHPAEATGPGDLAIALTKGLIPLLGESRAGAAIVPEGTDPPEGAPAILIAMPLNRRSLPEAT
ncbi:MAG: hypothetical protein GWO24_19695, partial [Akkermansiaceae bacterium]|nr:hypothetical protein [Akkermansiaceae bacterium]